MITIFTTPKPFKGKFKQIQENAIRSWIALGTKVEVFLMGNEPNISKVAKKMNVRHINNIKSNPTSMPYLNSLFKLAELKSDNKILAYVNSDIILLPDFVEAIEAVSRQKEKYLVVGRRIDLDLTKKINLKSKKEIACLIKHAKRSGKLHDYRGIDYFVYPKKFWKKIPPFAIARTEFDRWLVGEAKRISQNVIDATLAITAIHQNHDYSTIPGGRGGDMFINEAALNERLTGGVYGDVKSSDYILASNLILKKHNDAFDFEIFVQQINKHTRHFFKERIFRRLQDFFS